MSHPAPNIQSLIPDYIITHCSCNSSKYYLFSLGGCEVIFWHLCCDGILQIPISLPLSALIHRGQGHVALCIGAVPAHCANGRRLSINSLPVTISILGWAPFSQQENCAGCPTYFSYQMTDQDFEVGLQLQSAEVVAAEKVTDMRGFAVVHHHDKEKIRLEGEIVAIICYNVIHMACGAHTTTGRACL